MRTVFYLASAMSFYLLTIVSGSAANLSSPVRLLAPRAHNQSGLKQHRYVERHQRQHEVRPSASTGSGSMVGTASYYGSESGSQSASGTYINPGAMTAAHPSLPFGTKVRVTNQSNGRSVVVTINDRGPFVGGRIIDVSMGAADVIGMTGAGVARVRLEVVRN